MKSDTKSFNRVILLALLPIMFIGCAKENTPQSVPAVASNAAESKSTEGGPLSMTDFKLEKNESGKLVIKANVANASTKKLGQVVALFKLYDKEGHEIGEARANIDHLEAQYSWTFVTEVGNEATASVKFTEFVIK